MPRIRLLASALVLALLAGCAGVDYEARGDDLHRRGDYYGAVDSYKQVPAGDGTPELGSKLDEATENLREDAVKRAQRALDDGRFEEALTIARRGIDYVDDSRLHDIERQAKSGTVSKALDTGKLHLQRGEFTEAIANFETALRYDSSASTKALLLDAKAGAARKLAAQARQLAAANEYDAALDTIGRALSLHDAPEHRTAQRDIESAKVRWLEAQFTKERGAGMAAVARKEYSAAASHFRSALQYKQSEELQGRINYCESMTAAVAAMSARDFGTANLRFREAVDTGFDKGPAQHQLKVIEAERTGALQTAQNARAGRDYKTAGAAYRTAAAIRSEQMLDQWIRWCDHMLAGTTAVERGDYLGARDAFELALSEKLPDQGVAERARDSVRESTWTVSLTTMTAKPFKADDTVWDGSLRRALPFERIMAGFRAKRSPEAAKRAADAAALLLPPQNLPDLFIRVTLPDGSVWATEVRKETLHANIGAAFTVNGNAFSEAPVVITVRDLDKRGDEAVGTWATTVGALITGGESAAAGFEQVYSLAYTVQLRSPEPTALWTNGCTMEQGPTAPDTGTGEAPAPEGTTWTIRVNEIRVAPSDVPNEPRDGAPDAELTLTAGDEAVLNAFAGDNKPNRKWRGANAPTVQVTMQDGAVIKLALTDRDDGKSDIALEYDITNQVLEDSLAQGSLRLETKNGSYVDLTATKQ